MKLDEPQYGMDVQADPFVAYNKIMNFAVTSLPDLYLNIIYATDRQYLHVAVLSENLTMLKPAWKPLHPGKVTRLVKR